LSEAKKSKRGGGTTAEGLPENYGAKGRKVGTANLKAGSAKCPQRGKHFMREKKTIKKEAEARKSRLTQNMI